MPQKWKTEHFLSIYDHSREVAYHTDEVMWEIASIIWGANTLLLGFILEAVDNPRAQPLVILVSIIGIILTLFVARVCAVARTVKYISFDICRRIEQKVELEFPTELSVHGKIDEHYPKGMARRWIYGVTVVFCAVWLAVLLWAAWLFFCVGHHVAFENGSHGLCEILFHVANFSA